MQIVGRTDRMSGQWLGDYAGSSNGKIIVNIDECESNYVGEVVILEADSSLPSALAFFQTPTKDNSFKFRAEPIQALDPISGNAVPWDDERQLH